MMYILVPVFKRLEKTLIFLKSAQSAINTPYKVIICDDSPDLEHYKHFLGNEYVSITKGNGNLYWGGGVNACIDYLHSHFSVSESDIIIFANNDIVISENMFSRLLTELESNPGAIFHPRLINEKGNVISSGSRVISWFPFLTQHENSRPEKLIKVDLASARFLMFSEKTLAILKNINPAIPHYGGDNDFTLRAKKKGIYTYIVTDAICHVDESHTGEKIGNVNNFYQLLKSFFSLKSPNSIKYRYAFISSHFNPLFSALIVFSMTIKSIAGYLLRKSR